jgi:tetratricopeptide (TPR) repeat protein
MEVADPPFLDVQMLIEASQPRPRIAWMRFGMAGFIAALLLSWMAGRQGANEPGQETWSSLIAAGLLLLIGGMAMVNMLAVRQARAEQGQLQALEELIQLRRWPEAAMMLQFFLSRPARSAAGRAQALLYLAMVLARYHRFEESVAVHDYVLREIPLDDVTGYAVRLGRAMGLLREENLLDADRAIAELRRESRGMESAGLALVEIYRDVKTGHPAEAIEMFNNRLAVMRKQLGHRVADAWGLAARAYDLLDRPAEARAAYENATLLAPVGELARRYPEIAALNGKYSPAAAPAEVA